MPWQLNILIAGGASLILGMIWKDARKFLVSLFGMSILVLAIESALDADDRWHIDYLWQGLGLIGLDSLWIQWGRGVW